VKAEQLTEACAEHGEGPVWSPSWGGLRWVDMLAPGGRLDAKVDVPVRQVTACTFGGPRLDQLFITTSRLGLGPAAEPDAGAVFGADVGVAGLPASVFAG